MPFSPSLEPQAFRTTPITPLRFVLGRATRVYFHRRHGDTEKTDQASPVREHRGGMLVLQGKHVGPMCIGLLPAAVGEQPRVPDSSRLKPSEPRPSLRCASFQACHPCSLVDSVRSPCLCVSVVPFSLHSLARRAGIATSNDACRTPGAHGPGSPDQLPTPDSWLLAPGSDPPYHSVYPPSITSVAPVMYRDASLAR